MLIKVIRKIIMSAFLIYAFNMVAVHFNVIIPINFWTVFYITMFNFPGLGVLMFLKTIGV